MKAHWQSQWHLSGKLLGWQKIAIYSARSASSSSASLRSAAIAGDCFSYARRAHVGAERLIFVVRLLIIVQVCVGDHQPRNAEGVEIGLGGELCRLGLRALSYSSLPK